MELNQEHLKEKALLLVRRERELFELRMKHEQAMLWLQLTQSLPRFFDDPRTSASEGYAQIRKALLVVLRWQRASFFELREHALTPIVPVGAPRVLTPASFEHLRSQAAGFGNFPSDGAAAELAETLGLGRFLWSRIDVPGQLPVLLAAGFDRAKAKFQVDFDAQDAAHLRNATQHVQGLIGNVLLVREVEHERDRLQQTNETLKNRDRDLRALTEELRAANDTLEQRVRDRTHELGRRNRDMRLVLDNVMQGLVTVDAAGRLAEERSARIDEWFGPYEGNPLFVDYIARTDPEFAERFSLMHEPLIEGILPTDICLHQLPARFQAGARIFRCSYSLLADTTGGRGLLIMIDDVSEQVRLAQEEAEQSELVAVFQGLTRDRAGFLDFFREADQLVNEITLGELAETVRRQRLHTLKGIAGMRDAKLIADLCHRAEDQLVNDNPELKATIERLRGRWAAIKQTFELVVTERGEDMVEVPSRTLEQLCEDLEKGVPPDRIARQLMLFRFELVERPLTRLGHHARALARRTGRGELSVVIEASDARVDPRRFGRLWAALVHVIRNAIDHGIESPVERLAQGKSARGCLSLKASHTGRALTVEIADDGRGIDWARVRQIAEERGLPHQSSSDLLLALLSDRFSTKSNVTEMSGRGVGMSAVNAQVLELGGALSVSSEVGAGTCWRLVFPVVSTTADRPAINGGTRPSSIVWDGPDGHNLAR
jgi:HPt (histidine-containing phosphotransfer) domain-containing protein